MANNKIHTTFDLLSANVFNQSSLLTIDLPFELTGYSGTIDSSTGITVDVNKAQALKVGQRIIIKGFDVDATYKVQTEVTSVEDNGDGTISFLVLDNFIFEITEIMFYVPNDVKVKHGTIIDGNIQLTKIIEADEKYPLIFQHEITRETFFHDKKNKLERESEVDLFFLCTANFKDWTYSEHEKFAVEPMRELAFKFIEELKTSNGIGEFTEYEILNHVKFGVYITEKGHETRIFNDKSSGVQLKIKIPFLKTCGCNSSVVNIPTTPCNPRLIVKTLKNNLSNLGDVELTNPTNTQVLVYDEVNKVWVNQNQSGGGGNPDWDDIQNKPAPVIALSGTNTGDQDLSPYALITSLVNYLLLAGGTMSGNIEFVDGEIWIRQTDGTYTALVDFLGGGNLTISGTDGTSTATLNFIPASKTAQFTGTPDFIGATYDGDYSANFILESLITKRYADTKQSLIEKGQANGYVPLNASALIEQQYLPSYVDDIVEGYLLTGIFYLENTHITPIVGEIGKIYIDLTTGQSSKQYRWSGSVYIQITNGLIASTTDVLEGTNLYFTDLRAQTAAPAETASTIGAIVNGATNYVTPLDADKFGIWDSLNGFFKSLTWANLKATLKSYFDTLYSPISVPSGTIIVTSGTSFTTPSTITTSTIFYIELVGAGGGAGGMNTASSSASGGGGGGYCFVKVTGLTPSTSYPCAIGAGGNGGAAAANGVDGGNTTLTIGAVTYTASGGIKGIGAISSDGGAGGTGTNGDINLTGGSGGDSPTASTATVAGVGGNSPRGWGIGGECVRVSKNGNNGLGYGAGGSGGKGVGFSGGNGSNGVIFCKWFNQ